MMGGQIGSLPLSRRNHRDAAGLQVRTKPVQCQNAVMGSGELPCDFCGRIQSGGVAGPTPSVYICRDCIDLAHQMIDGPPLYDLALDTPEAIADAKWKGRAGPVQEAD